VRKKWEGRARETKKERERSEKAEVERQRKREKEVRRRTVRTQRKREKEVSIKILGIYERGRGADSENYKRERLICFSIFFSTFKILRA